MQYVVVINIDYENHSLASCRKLWVELDRKMGEAGFSKHKRLFVSSMDWQATCKQAQAVVANVEKALATENIIVFDLIKEFYCFEFSRMNDLLDPCHHEPDVSFLDTGAFMALTGSKFRKVPC